MICFSLVTVTYCDYMKLRLMDGPEQRQGPSPPGRHSLEHTVCLLCSVCLRILLRNSNHAFVMLILDMNLHCNSCTTINQKMRRRINLLIIEFRPSKHLQGVSMCHCCKTECLCKTKRKGKQKHVKTNYPLD